MAENSDLDLRTQLELRIEQMKKNSGQITTQARYSSMIGRGGFLTHKDLNDVFTDGNLRNQLMHDFSNIDGDEISSLAKSIQTRGPKLYAILLWIRESGSIKVALENGIDDDKVFTVRQDDEEIRLSYCTEKRIRGYPGFEHIAHEFYKNQWIIPPKLPTKTNQEFPAEYFIFPFEVAGERIAKGGNGEIYQVKIAPGFLKTSNGQQFRDVVYKRVKKHDNKDWEKILREVKALQEREHPNIIPLLSSFRTGREYRLSASDRDMYLYMIHPHADGSMEAWMEHKQDNLLVDRRQSHIRDMMYDLVSAVAYIHSAIGGNIAFHHDLKPSNILFFNRGREQLPIWKICDFGSANSKLAQGDTGTDNPMASYNYTPPEYWPRRGKGRLGRAWDVFSLGCIFLELATIYKYGWNKEESLGKFVELRTSNGNCPHSAEHTHLEIYQDASFFNNMEAVRSWLEHLRKGSSIRLLQILDLIEEMLEEERNERIFAFEVEIYLCQIRNPDMDLESREDLFRRISQPPNKSINGLDRHNNPLRRGNSKKWKLHPTLLKILKEKGWNDSTPASTEELNSQSRLNAGNAVTTLPGSRNWDDRLAADDLEAQNPKSFVSAKLYGRKGLNDRLKESFSSGAKCVALHGLWGMGKSHLAYQYASRLQNPRDDHKEFRKHTFWVSAKSVQTFQEDYKRIATAVNLSERKPSLSSISVAVREWLTKNSGTWLLVIDGLDLAGVLDEIQRFLPLHHNGQVLFTTRNRKILLDRQFVQSQHCHHVDRPSFETSWRIFKYHFGDPSLQDDDSYYRQILERLTCPLLMILAAKRMALDTMPSKDMYIRLELDLVDTVKDMHNSFKNNERQTPQYMEHLLRPLLGTSSGEKWSRELRLLCVLACFDTNKLEFDIIKWYNGQRGAMHEYVGTLKNCSFLEEEIEKEQNEGRVCKMPELVRKSVIAWVRQTKGEYGVWQRYQKMLQILGKRYNERMKDYKHEVNGEDWSYLPKAPLMPHFESFCTYTRSSAIKKLTGLTLLDDDIWCIVTLSHGFSAQGKYQQAIQVLGFASRFYGKGKHRYTLWRALLKAHTSYQHDRTFSHPIDWEDPERICQRLLEQCKSADNEHQKCELRLDLATIYRLREKWDEAAQQLRYFENLVVQKDEQGRLVSPVAARARKEVFNGKWLTLQVERARGQLNLAIGCHKRSPQNPADDEIEKAKIKFFDIKKIAMKWFPQKRTWIIDMDDLIAKATLENGTVNELRGVERMLEQNLREIRVRVSLRRRCETELLLAKVRMKSKKSKAVEVVRSLDTLYLQLRKDYGDNDRATSECQGVLETAHLRLEEYKRDQRRMIGIVAVVCAILIGLLIFVSLF